MRGTLLLAPIVVMTVFVGPSLPVAADQCFLANAGWLPCCQVNGVGTCSTDCDPNFCGIGCLHGVNDFPNGHVQGMHFSASAPPGTPVSVVLICHTPQGPFTASCTGIGFCQSNDQNPFPPVDTLHGQCIVSAPGGSGECHAFIFEIFFP